MTVLQLGLTPSVANAVTVEEAIAVHVATLAKLKTLYVQVETGYGHSEAPPEQMSVSESWRSGPRERTLQRVFVSMTPQGLKPIPEVDRVIQFSYSDTETRTLRGWDPAAPLNLPLDETKNASEFGRVKGGIGPRDPLGATSDDWTTLLLEITRGQSLTEFARTTRLDVDDSSTSDRIRLKVLDTDQANFVGAVIELDPQHGHLIRRLEMPKVATVAEVDGFKPFGDGIWLPERVRRVGAETTAIATLLEARVNEPIDDADLVVQFPEGARVEEVLTKRVHLWGKDGPAKTFESFALFYEHQMKRMKDAQPAHVGVAGGSNWLLWVNLVGIAALVLLMTFRKRLVEP